MYGHRLHTRMTTLLRETADPASTSETACWSTIGVQGDHSCPALAEHVHCRNCPVYSAAAIAVLDGELSEHAVREQTAHFAAPKTLESADSESVVVFRVGDEWLALPTSIVAEIAEMRPVHAVPHRRGDLILGVVNVRGELLVCVSLARLLILDPAAGQSGDAAGAVGRRLLVVRSNDVRVVAPVDEVAGILRFSPRAMKDVPAIAARASAAHSRAVLSWAGHSVGLLDGPRLTRSLRRSLS